MAKEADITPELVRQLIRFEPETGKYFWMRRDPSMFKKPKYADYWNRTNAGRELFNGRCARGYPTVKIYGNNFLAHRIAWVFHYGEWPDGDIDHINGVIKDNHISNLRVVSDTENAKNRRISTRNKTGLTGVQRTRSGRWQVQIGVDGKKIYLGTFDDVADAISARKSSEANLGFHPNHGLTPELRRTQTTERPR